jgi:hypothetical protein
MEQAGFELFFPNFAGPMAARVQSFPTSIRTRLLIVQISPWDA